MTRSKMAFLHPLPVVSLLSLLVMAAAPAAGQAPAPPRVPAAADTADAGGEIRPIELPELNVKAPRAITRVGGATAVTVPVDSLPLPAAPSLEQVLRETPLLHVRTNSRGEAEISARGSESRQVAILVDGLPLTLAWDGRADVSVIPATAPREVVYGRGLASMLHGPNILGGVIEANVGRLAKPPTDGSARLATGVDDYGRFGAVVDGTLPIAGDGGRWLLRGGLGYREHGDLPLARGVTERAAAEAGRRLNTDAEAVDGFFSIRRGGDSGDWVSLSGMATEGERGIAAELGVDEARFWRYPRVSRQLAVLSAGTGSRTSPFGGIGSLEASVGVDNGRTEIDSYTSETYEEKDGFENGKDLGTTLRVAGFQTLGDRSNLRAAVTLSNLQHEEIIPDGEFEYRQKLWSVGLENTWRLMRAADGSKSLSVTGGVAYDVGDTPEAGGREPLGEQSLWGGRLGLSLGLDRNDTVLHAGLSRRGRFPALRELYSGALNRFAPNPDLDPETLLAMEAGLTRRLGGNEFQAVAFHHRLDDAIVRITLPDRRFMRVNRNRLVTTGLELLASRSIGRVDLSGDLTLQQVELTDTEADETHEPENVPEVFGALHADARLLGRLHGGADVGFVGRQFCIDPQTGEDAELDAGALLNARLSPQWELRPGSAGPFGGLEARLTFQNLADTALYDQCGLPQPGRLVRLELRLF